MTNNNDIMDYVSELGKVHQTVEEIWYDDAPDDVEEAIMDALDALDKVKNLLQDYADKQELGE